MNDTFGLTELMQDLRLDEGTSRTPYLDTAGKLTIGTGRNLTDCGISIAEETLMLAHDIEAAIDQLDLLLSWWRELPDAQQRVMANLAFNMGGAKLLEFPVFLGAMKRQDWPAACSALEDSRWFHQVGLRGPRMVQRIATQVVD